MTKKDYPKQINIYLPERWEEDLKVKLKEYPPDFKFDADCFKYIGQIPYYIASNNKDMEYEMGFVPVSKELLSKRIHDYRNYLNYLVQKGLLEEDKGYCVDFFSGGLRYPAKYIRQKVKRSVIRKFTLIKSLLKIDDSRYFLQDNSDVEELNLALYPYLTKWISSLTIDEKLACEILESIFLKEKQNPIPQKKIRNWFVKGEKPKRHRKPRPDDFDYVRFRYNTRLITIKKIKNGDRLNCGPDTNVGRFHSFITKMKKELRPTISCQGKGLVAIDIKNSQPFLMISLLDPYVFTNNTMDATILKYNKNLSTNLSDFVFNSSITSSKSFDANFFNTSSNQLYQYSYNNDVINNISSYDVNNNNCTTMFVNFVAQAFENQDVKKYIDWVTSGTFYEEFGKELAQRELIPSDCTNVRELAKEITIKVLFGKNDSTKKVKKAVRAFREVFPTVFDVTEMVKFGDPENRSHSALACTLQNLEAEVVLQHCCGMIASERPDLPIFTIHDSIVTTVGNEEYVMSVMENIFSNLLGYVPKLDCQYWSSNSYDN